METIIRQNFPEHRRTFAILQPRLDKPAREKYRAYKVVNTKDVNISCMARVIEVLYFAITGEINQFPDWMSYMLFDHPADTIIDQLKQRYPDAVAKNEFEVWIAVKVQNK